MDSSPPSSDSLMQSALADGEQSLWEGKVLYRSGEEIVLKKAIDRFTVALNALDAATQLSVQLDAAIVGSAPTLGLVEVRVGPDRLDDAMEQARKLPQVQFASHVYQIDGSPDSEHFNSSIWLTNQITVQFAEDTHVQTMGIIADSLKLQVVKLVPGVYKAFVFEVTQQATANPIKLAHRLMRYPQVLMAEPNVAVPIQHYSFVQEEEERGLSPSQQQQVEAAWTLTQGDRSIVIAMPDREIDWQQSGLQGMDKIVAPVEFASRGQRAASDGQEREAEAPVAPKIPSARSKVQGFIAVAPDCALMPIGVGNWLDDQLIEQICEWAIEHRAAVLTWNWGADIADFPLSLRQRAALSRAALQGRDGKGSVVVIAAGDGNHPVAGMTEQDDRNQGSTRWLNGFAVHPDVITVAASAGHAKSPESNWGTGITVCAESNGGTGGASAIVAGIAALMLSVNPELTARAVKQILQETADRISHPESSSESPVAQNLPTGYYDALGYSQWFGYGRVNAFKAVQAAWQRLQPIEIPDRWVEGQNMNLLAIPDGELQGICSAIDIADRGSIKSVEVSLEVEHSFMGDLEIYLISPNGEAVLLQNRTLGRITTLRKIYNFETTPLLKTLLNQPVTGQWQLQLVDCVVLNTGQLKQWLLRIGVGEE